MTNLQANLDNVGPYRKAAEKPPAPVYDAILEERILQWRSQLPGPLRRLLALVFYVPVYVLSFVFACISGPVVWVLLGEIRPAYDAGVQTGAYGNTLYYTPALLMRGTSALFVNYDAADIRALRKYRGKKTEG